MKFIKIYLFFLLLSFQSTSIAGPWSKKKGHGYSQFSFTYLHYNRLLNGINPASELKRDINDFTYQLYGEYGLSNKLDFLFNLPYKTVSSGERLNKSSNDPYPNDTLDHGKLTAFSNLSFALKYTFIEKKYAFAAQLAVSNRMHQYQPNTGLRIGYDAHVIRPSLLIGRGWDKVYIQIELGLELNDNEYAQNLIGSLEVGRNFFEGKTWLMLRSDIKLPLTNGEFDEGNSVQTGLYRDNSSFVSYGVKGTQSIVPDFYLNLGIYGAFFAENEGAALTYSIALAYEW